MEAGEVAAAGVDADAAAAAAVTGATDHRTAVEGVDRTVAEGGTAGAETGKKGYLWTGGRRQANSSPRSPYLVGRGLCA